VCSERLKSIARRKGLQAGARSAVASALQAESDCGAGETPACGDEMARRRRLPSARRGGVFQ
jgi:hypothetical protein